MSVEAPSGRPFATFHRSAFTRRRAVNGRTAIRPRSARTARRCASAAIGRCSSSRTTFARVAARHGNIRPPGVRQAGGWNGHARRALDSRFPRPLPASPRPFPVSLPLPESPRPFPASGIKSGPVILGVRSRTRSVSLMSGRGSFPRASGVRLLPLTSGPSIFPLRTGNGIFASEIRTSTGSLNIRHSVDSRHIRPATLAAHTRTALHSFIVFSGALTRQVGAAALHPSRPQLDPVE